MALPDLSSFFASLLGGGRLGRSPGLGQGPSANPNVEQVRQPRPTAAGEGMRALWGQLPAQGGPKNLAKTAGLNANSLGPLFSGLFNENNFPRMAAGTPSPFGPGGFQPPAPQTGGPPTPTPSDPIPPPATPGPTLGPDGVPMPVKGEPIYDGFSDMWRDPRFFNPHSVANQNRGG